MRSAVHSEYTEIDSMLDQINSCLDHIEERNQALNGKLHELLESNRQTRRDFRDHHPPPPPPPDEESESTEHELLESNRQTRRDFRDQHPPPPPDEESESTEH